MECNIEQSEDKTVVTLEGDLTIVHAARLKKVLQEAIDNARHVEMKIENVTDMDLSCLQLLCSAHRTSKSMDRSISIAGSRPGILKEVIKEAGFPHEKGCRHDPKDGCLWIERT